MRTAKATRGPGLHLVDSQKTERHPAHDVPAIWPSNSALERLEGWYGSRIWPAALLLIAGCALMGAAIVAATYGWRIK